ncbi:response regulator transcription factor [Anaeromicropila populeti]|uniref:Stage 0 sporulation protein A homolog n=1 Tax=Anaeromicropila populeti TaxID=37658 RepID=A0A1I6KQY0_9FIRM|nr:response regulator transcription factor [Anaeromicropila populeti]SFR93659.1 two component transcriptional regulator, LuxR family [Anaeromicropila populeti]
MNILLIDDDKLVCSSLKIILSASEGIQVAGMAHDGVEAVELYRQLKPDILLMDIRMGTMTGLDAGEIILQEDPQAKILYLTTFLDDDYIVKALKIGAKGYMLKQDFESIVPALHAVYSGQNVYGNEIISKLPDLMSSSSDKACYKECGITEKEHEIILLIADGKSNKEMAEELFLSEGTIRNYISTILEKLELRDRTQIAIYYYKHK